jgi:hypothetical protein
MILKSSWSEIKRLSNEKNLPVQWVEALGQVYVMVVDGAFNVHCILDYETTDYEEFVASYKTSTSRRVSTSTAALVNPEDYRFRGTSTGWATCVAGQTTNIDITPSATEDRWVSGGILLTDNVVLGDTVSFSVVHPIVGVVETYVPSWSVLPGLSQQKIEVYPARIPAGLKLRVSYTSTGTSDASCSVNYYLHRRGMGT